MSDYRSVRVVSGPAAAPPRAARRSAERPAQRAYALIVALLTLASTAIAFFDLYLLASGVS